MPDEKHVPVGSFQILLPTSIQCEARLHSTQLVAGGDITDPPTIITYASVVSWESVKIALFIAALNALNMMGADISNANLTAPTTKCIIIVCALYRLKSLGTAYCNHLASYLREELHFQPCLTDPDVWLRLARRDDGKEYYEYLLVYVDALLSISEHPKVILNNINTYFKLKPKSVGTPDLYLGTKLSKVTLPNDAEAWCNSSHRYVQLRKIYSTTWGQNAKKRKP
jgi:hypothetical protein